ARALGEWEAVAATRFVQQAMAQGSIVPTSVSDEGRAEFQLQSGGDSTEAAQWAGVLRHERVPFVSYPYEWPFGMLQDAALLELDLLQAALAENFTLKDGTIYNVQWFGSHPSFIDVVSFERLIPGQPWAGYRQFCQTALFPLLLQAYRNFGYHALLRGRLDGIAPGECARLMSWRDAFRPGVLAHVLLHSRLERNATVRDTNLRKALPRAGFDKALIQSNAAGLAKTIRRLKWNPDSDWTGYAAQNTYSEAEAHSKAEFVRAAAVEAPVGLAWDLGCNIGEYSRIVAEHARYVVAMDADHPTIERLYQRLKGDAETVLARKILPLVANLADPSPSLGWRGAERRSIADRGRPDLVLCLALVHHLVIGAGIPMRELLEWLAGLRARLVIEFVDRTDPMVKLLLRNRRDKCADYERHLFDRWLGETFDVVRSLELESGTRTLYYVCPRT
ncbi:MAG: methyltransferase, partial [Planctomycetia bacterium]|nr:methyltransferase [Planctomycetia bacterium]